nr:hypodermin-B isoform X2 [Helicoverpa armigera]
MYYLAAFSFLGFISCEDQPLIVQGNFARIEDFPHSVYMEVGCKQRRGSMTYYLCGASILNEKIVMSAAHCLAECMIPGTRIHISVGKNTDGGQMTTLRGLMIHEYYVDIGVGLGNDIALARLNTALKFGNKVKRVALMANPPYHEKATVAGWGIINEIIPDTSPFLHYIDQYVLPATECVRRMGKFSKPGTLCAQNRNFNSYASRGDSGSALVVRGYIQIGIVSYKVPKISRSLVVYTDTGYFYDWITHNTKRLYCA